MANTFELFGTTWEVTDGRDYADRSTGARTVAHVSPVNAEGLRVSTVTVRGIERYIGGLQVVSYGNGRAYMQATVSDLTESNQRDISAVAVPLAVELYPELTHAEKVARAMAHAEYAGRSAARDAWRSLIPWESSLRSELTPADRAAIAKVMAEGFATGAAEGH